MCKFVDMVGSDPGPAMRKKRAFPLEILPIQTVPQIPNGRLSAEPSSLHLQGSPQHSKPAIVQRPRFNAKELEESNHASRQLNTPRSARSDDGADGFAASASIPPADGCGAAPSATGGACNFTVTGTIDGKFDYGYFVTVKIGSQLLHGVLYHIHQNQIGSISSVFNPHRPVSFPVVNPLFQTTPPSLSAATIENSDFSYVPATRSGGRRRRLKNRDPARPKPNRSSYNFFFAEKHFELKSRCPHMDREYSKIIGESWNKLTVEERQLYEEHAKRDKERYRKELEIYKERFNLSEPKQSQETPTEIDAPRIAEMLNFDKKIEIIADSKEGETLQRDARIAEDTKMEKQETTRSETQDYIEREEIACPVEIESFEKGPKKNEELAVELGKEGMNSAMEIDMMKIDSTDVKT